jgi:threonine aldolase
LCESRDDVAIRLVTSYATRDEDVGALLGAIGEFG